MIHPKIFRAYDIRGVYKKDFDLKGSEDIGKAYGTYLIRTSSSYNTPLRVVVGRDGRTHGPQIQKAFIRGLASTGIQVIDAELCFSPLLFFAICYGQFDGGVNITASHNPAEFNGFKLQRDSAHAICGSEIQKILEILEEEDFIRVGDDEILPKEEEHFWKHYKDKVLSMAQHPQHGKIVIDAGNGVAGAYAPQLFKRLGYDVVELFCEVDGTFPNHDADPEDEKNMQDLRAKVLEEKAHFGIAFDGDADRVGVVDDEGTIYNADYLIMLLSKDVLTRHPGASIVHTVTTTGLVKEEIERLGGKAIECKVGHSFVEEAMRVHGAIFGGESSGHLFFQEDYYGVDDGILAAVKIIEILMNSGISMKEHFAHLPQVYTSPEIKIEVADEKKFELVENVKAYFVDKYPCNITDGVKIDFGNQAWAICRASNTSAKVTIRAEARDDDHMKEIMSLMELKVLEEKKKLG